MAMLYAWPLIARFMMVGAGHAKDITPCFILALDIFSEIAIPA